MTTYLKKIRDLAPGDLLYFSGDLCIRVSKRLRNGCVILDATFLQIDGKFGVTDWIDPSGSLYLVRNASTTYKHRSRNDAP
jgi:hypothetical protein